MYTLSYPHWPAGQNIFFTFHMNIDAKPEKYTRKSNRCRHHGGRNTDICCNVVPSVTVSCRFNSWRQSLGHKALSPWQDVKMAHTPVWRWHTLLCEPNIAWAAGPLWVMGDTQDTMSRSVLRGSVWDNCCFSYSSSSDQGHIYSLSSKLTFMC